MFNFFKNNQGLDEKDNVIVEMLMMIVKFTDESIKLEEKKEITKEQLVMAMLPVAKLGELEHLNKYLRGSDLEIVNMVGAKLAQITRHFKESTEDDKHGK